MCECEREIVATLLPHQMRIGREYGTHEEYKVSGFSMVCKKCKGELEEAHPVAQIWGRKKKLDRYYWRELRLTEYQKVLEFLKTNDIHVKDIFDFKKKYSDEMSQFEKETRVYWQKQHENNPLYVYAEEDRADFIEKNNIPVIQLEREYVKQGEKGKWKTDDGKEVSAEEVVADYYRKQGYEVYRCERKIISTLIGAFLWTPINTPDSKLRIVGVGRKGPKFSKMPDTEYDKRGCLWFQLPEDFGSEEYFKRKKGSLEEWLDLLAKGGKLSQDFDYFLDVSKHLRDYLWVHTDEAEEATRAFLNVVPEEITLKIIRWAIEHFWDRQPGWPDFFVVKDKEYFFVEVKGIHDKLSPDQMKWLEWATKENVFKVILCRLKKVKS